MGPDICLISDVRASIASESPNLLPLEAIPREQSGCSVIQSRVEIQASQGEIGDINVQFQARALQSIIVNVVSAINDFFTLCLMPKPVAAIYDPTENRIIDRKTDENVFPLYNSRKLPVVHFVHCDRVQSDLRRVQQYHHIIIISEFLPNGTLPQRSGPSCAIAPTCAIL